MGFSIQDRIWDTFPGMQLAVAYAEGIRNKGSITALDNDFEEAQVTVKDTWGYPNAQSHPNVAAWRTAFKDAMGVNGKDFPSAVEALAKRVVSGKGLTSINPIVDFYNLLSIAHVLPVGGWDAGALVGGDIVLRYTEEDEMFRELGAPAGVPVAADEVCYADAETLITRHFVWRQSEQAKVTPATERLFLVSEVLPEAGPEAAEKVAAAFADGLTRYFGVSSTSTVLRRGDAYWDWEANEVRPA
jgi:DNA/RNA-binding domain of Phe-tRNA-synthetase-like protein